MRVLSKTSFLLVLIVVMSFMVESSISQNCAANQFLDGASCSNCNSTCFSCMMNANTCTACQSGYYLSVPNCIKCPDGCSSCFGALPGSCSQCATGYVYDTANSMCIKGSAAPAPEEKKSNTGAIVGGVIGGFVGLLIILGIIYFIWKKLKDPKKGTKTNEGRGGATPGADAATFYQEATPETGNLKPKQNGPKIGAQDKTK